MQLYEVIFQVTFPNYVDWGRAIVCAQDQHRAKEMVISLLELPTTAITKCDANRIKPNLYLIERNTKNRDPEPEPKSIAIDYDTNYRPSDKGLRAIASQSKMLREHRKDRRELAAQQQWAQERYGYRDDVEYECRIMATVDAPDDETALRQLGRELINRADGTKNERHVGRVHNVLITLDPYFGQVARTR